MERERVLVATPRKPWLRGRTGAAPRGARDRFGGKASAPLLGLDRRMEVTSRAKDVARLYGWVAGANVLVIEADRKKPPVVLPLASGREGRGRVSAGQISRPRGHQRRTPRFRNYPQAADIVARAPTVRHRSSDPDARPQRSRPWHAPATV